MTDEKDDVKTSVQRRSRTDIGDIDLEDFEDEPTVDTDGRTLPASGDQAALPTLRDPRAQLNQSQPSIWRRFGRYELLLELAAGGMATLYLARLRGPEGFEKLVALKIIHDHLTREASFVKMFFDEARIAALVHHPNVVQVLDLGKIANTHYIAMEYVHGKDYRAVLNRAFKLVDQGESLSDLPDWLIAARVAADAAAGLHAAHELTSTEGEPLALVHRDVSPHNILLSFDGHVKLTDFGIAYAKHRITHTGSGVLKGKVAYMSPEQAEGTAIDRRSDVFCLCIVLWEAVCRRPLFYRKTETATLHSLTHDEIPRPSSVRQDVPEELEQIIQRALAKDPGARYQTAHDLSRALERLIARQDDVIGSSELSDVMKTLFARQRARLDQELNHAIALADAEPEPTDEAVEARADRTDTNLTEVPRASRDPDEEGGVSETRLSAQVVRSVSAPPRGASQLTVRLIGLAALVIATIAGYLWWNRLPAQQRSGSRTASAPLPMKPPMEPPMEPPMDPPMERPAERPMIAPPARPRPAGKLVLSFVIRPAHARATILFRGKRYRQNRLDLLVTAGETTERVRVEAPGFHPLERFITVRPEASLKHELTLKPRRRVGMHRVAPRPDMDMTPRPVDIGFD